MMQRSKGQRVWHCDSVKRSNKFVCHTWTVCAYACACACAREWCYSVSLCVKVTEAWGWKETGRTSSLPPHIDQWAHTETDYRLSSQSAAHFHPCQCHYGLAVWLAAAVVVVVVVPRQWEAGMGRSGRNTAVNISPRHRRLINAFFEGILISLFLKSTCQTLSAITKDHSPTTQRWRLF